jgi:hypothetical protein
VGTGGTFASGGTSSALAGAGGTRSNGGTAVAGTTSATGGKGSGGTGGGGAAGTGATSMGTGGGTSVAGAGGSGANGGSTGGDATIVPDPSWTCGMPDGIPSPQQGTLVFKGTLKVGGIHDVGKTQYGKRRILDITGGDLKGDKITATVDTGGLDYELTLSNGAMELEQIMMLHTSDKTVIFLRVCGVAPAGDSVVRVVPDFEAGTSSSYAWLNTAKLVGTRTVDATGKSIQFDVYDVSKVAAGGASIKLTDPAGVPNQKWDCTTGSGSKGSVVFTETVLLGTSLSTGASKRGSRNVIPITGGTTTGLVVGAVLAGGADYQLAGTSGTTLDARYNLAPTGGDFVIVRNCGPTSALIPIFETRADGPYASLNTGTFWSDAPGGASGGVSITIRERK